MVDLNDHIKNYININVLYIPTKIKMFNWIKQKQEIYSFQKKCTLNTKSLLLCLLKME